MALKLKIPADFKNTIERAIDDEMNVWVDDLFFETQKNIVEKEIIDEGTLLKSGGVNREFLKKEIIYTAPHGPPVEFGTEPHQPPVEPLQRWAERKLGLRPKEAKKAAWAIATDIKKHGSEPRPFIRPAIDTFTARWGA